MWVAYDRVHIYKILQYCMSEMWTFSYILTEECQTNERIFIQTQKARSSKWCRQKLHYWSSENWMFIGGKLFWKLVICHTLPVQNVSLKKKILRVQSRFFIFCHVSDFIYILSDLLHSLFPFISALLCYFFQRI